MITINVDGKDYSVDESKNLLDALLELGLDVPYFCWHPAMGSVGSCRQCAVKVYADDQDQKGKIVMSCMTQLTDGMRTSVADPATSQFRDKSIEVTMANHPHDCPVCEEGGECHLQDMTIMSEHTTRRYEAKKRTYHNQDLGSCIGHEMNRCITCYRCVRFYNDYAGGDDLAAMSSRENVYFGRHQDGTLESPFSGNLIEVCPTGVFTDKPFSRSYTRKWDLQSAPSICTYCSVGCNTSPGERYGKIKRVVNRYHEDINRYFICDRGRFGYDHVNRPERLRQSFLLSNTTSVPCSTDAALETAQKWLAETPSGQLLAIGSARASVEENYALQVLTGDENFYSGLNEVSHALLLEMLDIQQMNNLHSPSLREIEQSDAVLILGENLIHSAPMMALSVRQATRNRSYELAEQAHIPLWQDDSVRILAQQQRSPLMIASVGGTELDDIASHTHYSSPDDIARIGFAIAHHINPDAPKVTDLTEAESQWVEQTATLLQQASYPVIISGSSLKSIAIVQAAAQIAHALAAASLNKVPSISQGVLALITEDCNSMGMGMLLQKQSTAHKESTLSADQHLTSAIDRVLSSDLPHTVIVLQNDLYLQEEHDLVDRFINKCHRLIVLDQQPNRTNQQADLLIPATTVFETEGTIVNYEGRAQRYFSAFNNDSADIKDNWKHFAALAKAQVNYNQEIGQTFSSSLAKLSDCQKFDDLVNLVAQEGNDDAYSYFHHWSTIAPNANFRIAGLKVPRQSSRYSGRTSMNANLNVSEPQQPIDPDSALAFSMEGVPWQHPTALSPATWAPGWNSNEAINKFQKEIGGSLRSGNTGVLLFSNNQNPHWYPALLKPAQPESGTFLTVTSSRIFDGETLSALSPALKDRVSPTELQLNPSDADLLGISLHGKATLTMGETRAHLNVDINPKLPRGIVIIPDNVETHYRLSLSTLPGWLIVEPCHE